MKRNESSLLGGMNAAAVGILWILIVLLVSFDIFDPDTYWHVANGRAMVESGRIINEDIFSFTSYGNKFVNHEWLAQILLFLADSVAGALGLIGFKIFLTLSICLILFFSAKQLKSGIFTASFFCLLFVYVALERFNIRPQLFSMLNLSLLGFILYGYRERVVNQNALICLPFLMVLWDFLHGAIYGVVFFSLFVLAETVRTILGHQSSLLNAAAPMEKDRFRILWIWALISLLAMVVNPYGLRSYDLFLQFIGENQMVALTHEFLTTPWEGFQAFWFFLAFVTISLFWQRKHIDLGDIIIFLPFAYLAVRYERASEALCPVMLPIAAKNTSLFYREKLERVLAPVIQKTLPILAVWVALVYVSYFKFFAPRHQFSFGYRIYEGFFPVGSVKFIKDVGLKGQLFNSGHFGGYLAYFLYPENRIYHYMHHTTFDISNLYLNDPALWRKWKARNWNINFAIVGDEQESEIFRKRGFVPVFRDLASFVWAAPSVENHDIIQKYGTRYFNPFFSKKNYLHIATNEEAYPFLMREMSIFLKYVSNKEIASLFFELIKKPNPYLSSDEREILITNVQASKKNIVNQRNVFSNFF